MVFMGFIKQLITSYNWGAHPLSWFFFFHECRSGKYGAKKPTIDRNIMNIWDFPKLYIYISQLLK
jgi:hypothetical protein